MTPKTPQHSPTPWKTGANGGGHTGIWSKGGASVCVLGYGQDEDFYEMKNAPENAAFIVQAVNAHEALVNAVKYSMTAITRNYDLDETYEMLEAALKLAGEKS